MSNNQECTRCKGTEIVTDFETGEVICGSCGLVLSDTKISMGPEWRAFTPMEGKSRSRTGLGRSYLLYDMGMSTVFKGYRDGVGKPLNVETQRTMSRLSRYDNRSKITETWRRNLSIAMAELDRVSDGLHLPSNTKERAAILYRKALKKDLIRGRSIEAFVAACIYAICRQSRLPRQLKEISALSKREYGEIARTYRLVVREIGLRMPVDDPIKFIPKMASSLNVTVETERRAIEILRQAKELNGLSGKDPKGIAAAALYKACQENKDKRIQRHVAQAAGTTEVTLRNRLKGLETLFARSPALVKGVPP